MIRELKLLSANMIIKFLVIRSLERELTAEKCIEEDTESPNISWRSRILDLADNLRGHV